MIVIVLEIVTRERLKFKVHPHPIVTQLTDAAGKNAETTTGAARKASHNLIRYPNPLVKTSIPCRTAHQDPFLPKAIRLRCPI